MCQYEIVYKEIKQEPVYEEIVRNVFEKCFEEENIQNSKMYITVTFTNPENIQKINRILSKSSNEMIDYFYKIMKVTFETTKYIDNKKKE